MFVKVYSVDSIAYYINMLNVETMVEYKKFTDQNGKTLYTKINMSSGAEHVVMGNCDDLVKQFSKIKRSCNEIFNL